MEEKVYNQKWLNKIAGVVLDSSITVHKEMGPGLLEGVYHHCLFEEISSRGLKIERDVPVYLHYKQKPLNKEYVIDILVEDEVILELKSVETLLPVHEAQVISYLRLSNKQLGFLINFNVSLLKLGFKRFINKQLYGL
jgi:GxxExxY protein